MNLLKHKLLLLPPLVVLPLLAPFGCAPSDTETAPSAEEQTGTLGLPLSIVHGDSTLRFLGTIRILSTTDGSVAATVVSDGASPATHTVSLLPGAYSIEIEEGYTCSVEPNIPDFTSCSYVGSSPEPFGITAGIATQILLSFTFHFEEDVEVVFRTGEAVLSLAPVLEQSCDCGSEELCVSIDGAPAGCAATCESHGDCDADQACFPLSAGPSGVCGPGAGAALWVRQFGSSASDVASSVSADASGNVFVAGLTSAALPGQRSAGATDAYVRKYDANGTEAWTRQFGSDTDDSAYSVSADANGNALVAGDSFESGDADAYVRKYDASGNDLGIVQFATDGYDSASSVSADASGGFAVAGYTNGALPGQTSAGGIDVFVSKYDASSTQLWTRQFGTSTNDLAYSVSVDTNGNVVVAGYTSGALPGQTSAGSADAFVRKYSAGGTQLWTQQLGTSGSDLAYSVSTDASGNIFVAGQTSGALPGQTSAGSTDAFLRKYDAAGTELWTRQFGTSTFDGARSVSVDASGNLFVVGATDGTLPGQTSAGGDAFVRKYDAGGTELWTRQLGTRPMGMYSSDGASSVSADASGNAFVAGYTEVALPGQVGAGGEDAFLVKLAP